MFTITMSRRKSSFFFESDSKPESFQNWKERKDESYGKTVAKIQILRPKDPGKVPRFSKIFLEGKEGRIIWKDRSKNPNPKT